MVALLAAVAVAGPPKAFLHAGSAEVRLAVSSWCWRNRCGAPIAASKRVAVAPRGSVVAVELTFTPKRTRVEIAGRPVAVSVHGHELSWPLARGGGVTITVTSAVGWVTYVGRLRVH